MRRAVARSRLGAGRGIARRCAGIDRKKKKPPLCWNNPRFAPGSKPPIAAKALNISPRTQTVDLIYTFPKIPLITSEDKEVEVVLRSG